MYARYPLTWGDGTATSAEHDMLIKHMRVRDAERLFAVQAGMRGFNWPPLNTPGFMYYGRIRHLPKSRSRDEDMFISWRAGVREARRIWWWRFRVKAYKTMWRVGRVVAPKTTRQLKNWRRRQVGA